MPACTEPPGYAAIAGDCDEANSQVHPGMTEVCNGLDDDCDGGIDNGVASPAAVGGVQIRLIPGSLEVSWVSVAGASSYDVVRGGLDALRTTQGGFASAVDRCVADDLGEVSVEDPSSPGAPSVWYLVRAGNCGGEGTYSSGGTSERSSQAKTSILPFPLNVSEI